MKKRISIVETCVLGEALLRSFIVESSVKVPRFVQKQLTSRGREVAINHVS